MEKITIQATVNFTREEIEPTLLEFAEIFYGNGIGEIDAITFADFIGFCNDIIVCRSNLRQLVKISIPPCDYVGIDLESDMALFVWDFYRSALSIVTGLEYNNIALVNDGVKTIKNAFEGFFPNGELDDFMADDDEDEDEEWEDEYPTRADDYNDRLRNMIYWR